MNCYWCTNEQLIWGGDIDVDESMGHLYPEYSVRTNLSCPKCHSEYEVLKKLNELIKQGEKSNLAARKIAEETGYEKKWLYSKLHKKLDK